MKSIFNFFSLIFTPILHFLFGAKESTFDEDCVDSEVDIATHRNQVREEFIESIIKFLEPCNIKLKIIENTSWFSNNGTIRNTWPLALIEPYLLNGVRERWVFRILIDGDIAQCSLSDYVKQSNGYNAWVRKHILRLDHFNYSSDEAKKCALHILSKVQELKEKQSCRE